MQENENSAQVSLFGEMSEVQIPEPVVPPCDTWGTMEKLKREKEVVGIYISGHPLDDFKTEIKYFCNASLSDLRELTRLVNREVSIAGVITDIQHRTSKMEKVGPHSLWKTTMILMSLDCLMRITLNSDTSF